MRFGEDKNKGAVLAKIGSELDDVSSCGVGVKRCGDTLLNWDSWGRRESIIVSNGR